MRRCTSIVWYLRCIQGRSASPKQIVTLQDDCQWDSREDYRKPLPRQQVQALVTRVDYLERLLREHGIDTESSRSRQRSPEHGRKLTQDRSPRDGVEDGDPRDLSLDHLVSLIFISTTKKALTSRLSVKMGTSIYMDLPLHSGISADILETTQMGSTSSLRQHPAFHSCMGT